MHKVISINEYVEHRVYVAEPPTPKLSVKDELYFLL